MALEFPALPLIIARFGADARGELSIDGTSESFAAESSERLREVVLERVTSVAAGLRRPVQVTVEDDEGSWLLVVHPDGEIGEEEVDDVDKAPAPVTHLHRTSGYPDFASLIGTDTTSGIDVPAGPEPTAFEPDDSPAASNSAFDSLLGSSEPYVPVSAAGSPAAAPPEPSLPAKTAPAPVPRTSGTTPGATTAPTPPVPAEAPAPARPRGDAPGRTSFIRDESQPDRATQGWRGFLVKLGLPVPASRTELAERAEVHAVSQHWAGPRTIAIVNGKGGANKTPTTAMLSAVFARNGGSGVLAWDNNETRGTLGWRTEQGPHDATVQSLLPAADRLLSSEARASDLGAFTHHQRADKYDVLRSNPTMLATEQRISSEDFDRLHTVASRFFRLIVIDSGNDESAERWLRMIDHTDQLVIATTALDEHAEAGALLLEALGQRDERSARLARNAVVIVSQSERTGSLTDARKVAAGFETLARRSVTVPFDPQLHGGRLAYDALAPQTRRAWLHAASAVADGL